MMEQYVGLEEIDNGVCDVFYCFCQIGRYHHGKNKLEDVISRVPTSRRLVDAPWKRATDVWRVKCYPCPGRVPRSLA